MGFISDHSTLTVPSYDNNGQQNGSIKLRGAANKANYALAQSQNAWNIDQWNRQNEYNSPKNQIALLKEAGLNPNLYANQGATAEGLVSADMANQQDMSGQYLNAMQMGLQNFNASLDRDLQSKAINLEKQKIDLESARVENETRKTDSDISLQSILGLEGLSNIELNEENKKTLQKGREESDQRMAESRQKVDNMKTENGISVKQLNSFDKDKLIERAMKIAQKDYYNEQIHYVSRLCDLSYEEEANLKLEGTKLQLDTLMSSQAYDHNQTMNRLIETSQKLQNALKQFEKDHQNADWWIDNIYRNLNQGLDVATTAATFGISRAIKNFSPFGGQQQRRMPFNQSFSNQGHGFEQHMRELQSINGW